MDNPNCKYQTTYISLVTVRVEKTFELLCWLRLEAFCFFYCSDVGEIVRALVVPWRWSQRPKSPFQSQTSVSSRDSNEGPWEMLLVDANGETCASQPPFDEKWLTFVLRGDKEIVDEPYWMNLLVLELVDRNKNILFRSIPIQPFDWGPIRATPQVVYESTPVLSEGMMDGVCFFCHVSF